MVAFTRTRHHCNSSGPSLHGPVRLASITSLLGSIRFTMFTNPTGSPGNHITTLHIPNNTSLAHGRVSRCNGFIGVCNTGNLTCVGIGRHTGNLRNVGDPMTGFLGTRVVRTVLSHATTRSNSVVFFNTSGGGVITSTVNTLHLGINGSLNLASRDG